MTDPHATGQTMSEHKPEYEGKAKQVVPTDDPNVIVQRFKDSATAFNAVKKAEFEGKGRLNNAISSFLFGKLEEAGIPTHFIERANTREMRCRRLEIVPLEIVVRNVAAGSLSKRLGWAEGRALPHTIVETYYKRDELGDPILCDAHIELLEICSADDLAAIRDSARKVNEVLRPLFAEAGLTLVDFKLEYGFDADGRLLLGDEISPDNCRLWDVETQKKYDKDVFRRDLADLVETYEEVARRLGVDASPDA